MKIIQQTINAALSYIVSQQDDNGGFCSDQGKSTTFYTSLILSTLSTENDSRVYTIRQRGAAFLLREKSELQQLNYWQQGSAEYGTIPYPNDIDDTFVAMQALYCCDASLISEEVVADLVSLLITQETVVGGPYKTWITTLEDSAWHDVDIVANSNVAVFLQLIGVELPQLQSYLDTALTTELHSLYYHHLMTTLYFLARAYRGPHLDLIIEKVLALQHGDGSWGNPLHTAFALMTLLRLGIPTDTLEEAVSYLLQKEYRGTWNSTDLYIESIPNKVPTYSSCCAYVSTCCLEALRAYESALKPIAQSTQSNESIFIHKVHDSCMAITTNPLLQKQLEAAIAALSIKDPANEIALTVYNFSKHITENTIEEKLVEDLAVANTLGWIGYSIYDSILDGEDKISLLPLANTCIKAMINIFKSLTDDIEYLFIQRILEGIDAATLWEHTNCKLLKTNGAYVLPDILPDYKDHHVLAMKSLGHAIGPMILMVDQATIIEEFFTHYLIARQLNDDAHDWHEDLQNGWINSVSVGMIQKLHTLNAEALQSYFWERHIEHTVEYILMHIERARLIVKKATLLQDMAFLESLLVPLEQSAWQALNERDKTKRFLEKMQY
ncbi:MAG: hypothetical protein JWL92_129 [Candidatus Nomurabacteria bacterium]|nr:hypothetical protein [Candidatus Nomurabacteria bacterium]